MVTVPTVLGIIFGPPAWIHLPLAVCWWSGYFWFYAVSVWMRSRFNLKHRPAVLTYGALTVVTGLITLGIDWKLLVWALPYAPLIAVAIFETFKRRPRSLLSGEATVFAATLMFPVMIWASVHTVNAQVWLVWAILTAYYFGSIPYVKTLIRNRGDKGWFYFSVGLHLFFVVVAAWAASSGMVHWLTVFTSVVLTTRAWYMPWSNQRRTKPWTPKQVGKYEIFISLLVIASAVLTWFV